MATKKKLLTRRKPREKVASDMDKMICHRLRAFRLAAKMSQTNLGNILGVTFQQIQKYEKGINRVGAGRLTKIANVLQVPVSNLLEADDSTGATPEGQDSSSSPLKLLTTPGALRVLRAYEKLTDAKMRHAVVAMVESIAAGRR